MVTNGPSLVLPYIPTTAAEHITMLKMSENHRPLAGVLVVTQEKLTNNPNQIDLKSIGFTCIGP